jgi:hypothetical protein
MGTQRSPVCVGDRQFVNSPIRYPDTPLCSMICRPMSRAMVRRTPIADNIAAMRRTIEAAGIRLLFDGTGRGAGIAHQDADIDLSGAPSD